MVLSWVAALVAVPPGAELALDDDAVALGVIEAVGTEVVAVGVEVVGVVAVGRGLAAPPLLRAVAAAAVPAVSITQPMRIAYRALVILPPAGGS